MGVSESFKFIIKWPQLFDMYKLLRLSCSQSLLGLVKLYYYSIATALTPLLPGSCWFSLNAHVMSAAGDWQSSGAVPALARASGAVCPRSRHLRGPVKSSSCRCCTSASATPNSPKSASQRAPANDNHSHDHHLFPASACSKCSRVRRRR